MGRVTDLTNPANPAFLLSERYEVGKLLGEGGMGIVYQAYDTHLERQVALKVLSRELATHEEARTIFRSEALALAALNHTNLISIYDVIVEEGHPCMVMEFVDGKAIDTLVQPGGVDIDVVWEIVTQVLAGLAYLHDAGLVHRDIKPSNLMLSERGEVKIADFGLARSLTRIQAKGTQVRGTPAYMPPEQITGEELTQSTDIYAFGASIFELLTGRLVFEEGDLAFHHVYTPAPKIVTLRPDIPVGLANIIDQCLSKDPKERPKSARTILRELVSHRLESEVSPSVAQALQVETPIRLTDALKRSTGGVSGGSAQPEAENTDLGAAENKKSPLIFGLIAALLLLGVGVGLAFFFAGGSTNSPTEIESTAEPVAIPSATAPAKEEAKPTSAPAPAPAAEPPAKTEVVEEPVAPEPPKSTPVKAAATPKAKRRALNAKRKKGATSLVKDESPSPTAPEKTKVELLKPEARALTGASAAEAPPEKDKASPEKAEDKPPVKTLDAPATAHKKPAAETPKTGEKSAPKKTVTKAPKKEPTSHPKKSADKPKPVLEVPVGF